jgi:hypothetical protein
MDLDSTFAFKPTTPLEPTTSEAGVTAPPQEADGTLLNELIGEWKGSGLNIIWRPVQESLGSDHFLEINVTSEDLVFEEIPGKIPNRGFLQGGLFMTGLHYLQQVSDSNLNAGLHVEPGVWLSIPATVDPPVPATVARLASIPHGTTVVAQGFLTTANQAPQIPVAPITPFAINSPGSTFTFDEQTLSTESKFRTGEKGLTGVTQDMLNSPNSILAVPNEKIVRTTTFQVFTQANAPLVGGGTANTAFLQGLPPADIPPPVLGPNADAAELTATFWLQTTEGSDKPDLLQYSQTVLLNFNDISWPHVSVATLRRKHRLL